MASSYSPTVPLSLTPACSRAAVKPSQSLHLRVSFSSPSAYRSSFPLSHNQALSLLPNSLPSLKLHCVSDSKAPVVTQNSWEKEVLKSETPVLVEFYASWCGPCRMVHRVIDEIAEEYAGRLKCVLLNTDDDSQIAEEHEIKAVPVVLIFKDGQRREIVAGTMPKDFYISAIERVLNPTTATSSQ